MQQDGQPTQTEFSVQSSRSGGVFWFTGLPGSGKTSITEEAARILREQGLSVVLLDGDTLRKGLNKDLGFQREDRRENVRRIGEIALLLSHQGIVCFCAVIAPYSQDRQWLRERIGSNWHEIYLSCPAEVCAQRDYKGHFAKAQRGEIKNFTGVSDQYEPPENPELLLQTHLETLQESANRAISYVLRVMTKS